MTTKFLKTKKEITNWLYKYNVANTVESYELIPSDEYGFVVDVNGFVDLANNNLTEVPVKFNHVTIGFSCANNNLKNLDFAPIEVNGKFNCSENLLTSLKGCPQIVDGNFDCSYNQLTSLEFSPSVVSKEFDCSNNQVTSLEFCSQKVGEDFNCSNNKIMNLMFFPKHIGGYFWCDKNEALGDLQYNIDFKKLYQSHLDCVRKIEYEKLNGVMNRSEQIIRKNKI